MSKIRVLVVDDAVVVRRMVSDVLGSDPLIEVVGTAANGKLALAKIEQLKPDVVTLDVEMPEMDGLETLRALRREHSRVAVIMFSTLTERGASATIEALALGAADYVTKPANVGSVAAGIERLRADLLPKVKGCCRRRLAPPHSAAAAKNLPPPAVTPAPPVVRPAPRQSSTPIELLVIGVSTGGPNALRELLTALPGDFPVPIAVVQHMPATFTRLLAEHLNAKCALRVQEAKAGDLLLPGGVWIAPGDFHLELSNSGGRLHAATSTAPPEGSCRPAVDVLFRSAARITGSATLALILTGMGKDGLVGCGALAARGAQILVQDEPTSIVWGMPGAVATAGLANAILPLPNIAAELIRRVSTSRHPELVRV